MEVMCWWWYFWCCGCGIVRTKTCWFVTGHVNKLWLNNWISCVFFHHSRHILYSRNAFFDFLSLTLMNLLITERAQFDWCHCKADVVQPEILLLRLCMHSACQLCVCICHMVVMMMMMMMIGGRCWITYLHITVNEVDCLAPTEIPSTDSMKITIERKLQTCQWSSCTRSTCNCAGKSLTTGTIYVLTVLNQCLSVRQ